MTTIEERIAAMDVQLIRMDTRLKALEAGKPAAVPAATAVPGGVLFAADWKSSPSDGGFDEQAKVPGRATLVAGRDGRKAVRLHTEPGDNNCFGSGDAERNDLSLSQELTQGYEGREAWWAHSILFPAGFAAGSGWYVVFDFHNTADDGAGQANFNLDATRWDGDTLHMRGYGEGGVEYETTVGPIVRNVWYDFVYHVRWSSGADGFFDAWVNGRRVLSHKGPTLYKSQGVYLKLANYHEAHGKPSSVIHERIIRGTTQQSVARGPLQ